MDSEGDGSAFWGMLLNIRERCECPLWHHQVSLFQARASVFLAGFTFLISAKTVDTFRSGNVAKHNFCSAWGLRTDSTSLRSVWLRSSHHTSELVCLQKTIPVTSWTLLRFWLPAGVVRRGFLPFFFFFFSMKEMQTFHNCEAPFYECLEKGKKKRKERKLTGQASSLKALLIVLDDDRSLHWCAITESGRDTLWTKGALIRAVAVVCCDETLGSVGAPSCFQLPQIVAAEQQLLPKRSSKLFGSTP